jgi:hypothetical protein
MKSKADATKPDTITNRQKLIKYLAGIILDSNTDLLFAQVLTVSTLRVRPA